MKKFLIMTVLVVVATGLTMFSTSQKQKVYAEDFTLKNQAEKLVIDGVMDPIVAGLTEVPTSIAEGIMSRETALGKVGGLILSPLNGGIGAGRTVARGVAGALNVATSWCWSKRVGVDLDDVPKSI